MPKPKNQNEGRGFALVRAQSAQQIAQVRRLFEEYAAWLGDEIGIDLAFQDFHRELANLPGYYAPPRGRLILAVADNGAVAGCAAIRDLGDGACELKRMYVRSEFRRRGIAHALADALIAEAKAIGDRGMCLDTDAAMTPAITLYRSLGFRSIAPYYHNPYPGSQFMELALD
jgi:ribosomal protein S18 acetylase RimI-like enzyme